MQNNPSKNKENSNKTHPSIGFWRLDKLKNEKNQIFLSRPLINLLGYNPNDYSYDYKSIRELIHPQDQATLWREIENSLDTGRCFSIVSRIAHKDGSCRFFSIGAQAEQDKNGKISAIIGVCNDVTETIDENQNIEDSSILNKENINIEDVIACKDRHKIAMNISSVGIWEWEAETDSFFLTEPCCNMLGYEDGELNLTATNWYEMIHPEDFNRIFAAIDAHKNLGRDYDVEYRMQHKSGYYIWVHSRGQMQYDGEGRPTRMVGSIEDITRRIQALVTCRKSETYFRDLAEGALYGICIHRNFIPLFANKSFAKLYGFSRPDDVLRIPSMDSLIPPNIDIDTRILWEEVFRGNGSDTQTERLCTMRQDGSYVWVDIIAREILWQDGPATQITVYDATERVAHESNLEASRMQMEEQAAQLAELAENVQDAKTIAEEAARIKADFLATMSHEIRTPLNAVIGMNNLLLDTDLNEEQRTYAISTKNAGKHLLLLINDILDFSKLEAGKVSLEKTSFNIKETIENSLDILKLQASEKKLEIGVKWHNDITPSCIGDSSRIKQIMLNLVGNAIKFTKNGKITIDVKQIKHAHNKQKIYIGVNDTGIGIAKDKIDNLFQKFSQEDTSTTRKYGGSGLGLAITKKLVGLMGGDIGVTSEKGEGSCFWFEVEFPIDSSKISKDAQEIAQESTITETNKSQLHILVAEDSAVNQMLIRVTLEKMGHVVEIANNGLEAVDMAEKDNKTSPYDLILMDSQMPEMDGIEATQKIRGLKTYSANLPIIALTADAMDGAKERFLKNGMDDFLAKPFEQAQLKDILSRWSKGRDEGLKQATAL